MKDICQAIYEYLSRDAQVRERVGGRLYPVMLPQDAPLPAIVYSPVLANYDSALTGDTGYVRQTIQFNCHDTTFMKARELSRLIKRKLQDYHGEMSGLYIEAVFIKSDFLENANTALKFSNEEYMAVIEFDIHYNEERDAPPNNK